MVFMVIKLACLVVEDLGTNRYWKALKQLLPLSAFPMLFFIFEMPECSYMYFIIIQRHALSTPNEGMLISGPAGIISLWSALSCAVIIHISVFLICGKKRKPINVSDSRPLFTQH